MGGFEIVIGGALFWLLVIATVVMCEISTVKEEHWGFAWLGLLTSILWVFSSFNPLVWMWHNPWQTISFAMLYIGVGIVWGFVKWWFHLQNEKDKITSAIATLKANYAAATSRQSGPFTGTFTDYLEDARFISRASQNKTQISVWMFWWPFSMFWTTFNDVLRRFYNWVIEYYISVFDKINKAVFGSLNN